MKYPFPYIEDIEQVRAAIAGYDEFKEIVKGDYTVFNYLVNFENTFSPVMVYDDDGCEWFDIPAMIRRECRGLVFNTQTGKLIRRPYHKFFNVNEKYETQISSLDFTEDHYIYEKLDGSMIAPFRIEENTPIIWGTKMGQTDISVDVMKWISHNIDYIDMVDHCLKTNHTPIFEWCSRSNRVVIDHPVDRLVLTGVRHIYSGEYFGILDLEDLANIFDVECIRVFREHDFKSMQKALESDLEGSEGFVVRFDESGHMVKAKGSWYMQLHKTLEHIQHEKDLIHLILSDKLDDAKSFLPSDLVEKLDTFGKNMFINMRKNADLMTWEAVEFFDASRGSKKKFAEMVKDTKESGFYFKVYDFMAEHENAQEAIEYTFELIKDKVSKNLSTQTKVDSIRHLIGVKWEI